MIGENGAVAMFAEVCSSIAHDHPELLTYPRNLGRPIKAALGILAAAQLTGTSGFEVGQQQPGRHREPSSRS